MAKTRRPKIAVTQRPVNSKKLIAKMAKWAIYQDRANDKANPR